MKSNNCLVIDPVSPKYADDAIKSCKYNLKGRLATHHHR